MATSHVDRIDWSRARPPADLEGNSERFVRQTLVDGATGSTHMGFGACELQSGGRVGAHLHSYEESFFVLEGTVRLTMQDETVELGPEHCGLIPVGVPHAWSAPSETARWLEMLAPRPRVAAEGRPADTFFLDDAGSADAAARPVDIRDPRVRHLFRLGGADMDLDALKKGSRVEAPTVSASMATALLAYSGIAVKMLVDQRLDAQLSTMFMVEYQPGGVAHPHDHPLEECYVILEGEVDAVADGTEYTLREGDVFWTAVGCVHAFYNRSGSTVRWLETQAPQPPARHSYRFDRDWEYLETQLESAGETG